jgi:hypothetical protein
MGPSKSLEISGISIFAGFMGILKMEFRDFVIAIIALLILMIEKYLKSILLVSTKKVKLRT